MAKKRLVLKPGGRVIGADLVPKPRRGRPPGSEFKLEAVRRELFDIAARLMALATRDL